MANENLFGAAVRSLNSPTLAYMGYNHEVPKPPHDQTNITWNACLPAASDADGDKNFRPPYQGIGPTDDNGDTGIYNTGPLGTSDGDSRQMLWFTLDNSVNGNERYTSQYLGDAVDMVAKTSTGQSWHFTCNVRQASSGRNGGGSIDISADLDITAWIFFADSSYAWAPGNIETITKAATVINGFTGKFTVNGEESFGSSKTSPLNVTSCKAYQLRLTNLYYGTDLTQYDLLGNLFTNIDFYFTVSNSSAQYVTVRFDIDNGDNDHVYIDKWGLRPMNNRMSDYGSSDISLLSDVYTNIQTTDPGPTP